jgi:hypothetical protein
MNMKKIDVLGLKVKADIVQADGIKGFACYLPDSVRKNKRCIIGLNVFAFIAAIAMKQLRRKDIPYLMAECIMHEVIHAFEDWAKVEFSHRKVNKLINVYREHYLEKSRKKTGRAKKKSKD